VSYYVRFEQEVRDYIAAIEGLSLAGRAAVIDGVIEELGRDADEFLAKYPLGPDSSTSGTTTCTRTGTRCTSSTSSSTGPGWRSAW
jgi:hypothetical protein